MKARSRKLESPLSRSEHTHCSSQRTKCPAPKLEVSQMPLNPAPRDPYTYIHEEHTYWLSNTACSDQKTHVQIALHRLSRLCLGIYVYKYTYMHTRDFICLSYCRNYCLPNKEACGTIVTVIIVSAYNIYAGLYSPIQVFKPESANRNGQSHVSCKSAGNIQQEKLKPTYVHSVKFRQTKNDHRNS